MTRLRSFMKNSYPEKGSSIVEAMVAIIFISLIVIAGAAFAYHSSVSTNLQRNKRLAIEAANLRLEEMRSATYTDIAPFPADNEDIHYIKKVSGSWEKDSTDDETVNIHGIAFPITTTVHYIDAQDDVPVNSYDFLRVVVRVGYRLNPDERVTLETYIR